MGKRVLLLLAFLVVFTSTAIYAAPEKAPAGVDATADTDGDGMPDWWEVKYFGQGAKFNKFNGKMDLDGDKIGNLDEYKIGTPPLEKKIDKNGDGVADDWMVFYGLKDANADDDNDEYSNLDEFKEGTNPKDAKSKPKDDEKVSQVHAKPSMDGVRDNLDKSIPDNHQIKPGVFKYNDPIGDDKGPGYYTYPTNPVYARGGFDIVSFEVDTTSKDYVIFKITINTDLKQEWGMSADFDIQHFQVYIDQDRVAGSGQVKSIPGLNVYFDPGSAWDRVVLITPQPSSRVQIEVDAKAPEFSDYAVVPFKISGQGRTITAVVKKKDLGADKDTDYSTWAWQVVAQSNEGFPDPDDVITRNVNEYRGLHRFGSGSDYWGDPELMDILVWPAMGSVQEAKDQFDILNVWESYPDPTLDIKSVVPLVDNEQKEQWNPNGGYQKFAKNLATKIKPPAQKDKYVSDNFDLFGKLFTRWNWNLDVSKENKIRNSLELGIDGKIFTGLIDFYLRFELNQWENTEWKQWVNSTPGQVDLALQSRRVMLINPFKSVDLITVGNNEVTYSGWTLGAPWYPDRDKTMGIFVDGSIKGFNYGLTVHYPMEWIGFDWGHGGNNLYDLVYAYKIQGNVLPGLKLAHSTVYYTDYEVNPQSTTPKGLFLKGYNLGTEVDGVLKLPLGFNLNFLAAYAETSIDPLFTQVELGYELDIDGNGELGVLTDPTINLTNAPYLNDWAAVVSLRNTSLFGTGIGMIAEGFRIGEKYNVFTSSRGDTSGSLGGFGGGSTAGTADVLAMNGNQSVHRSPQAADFVADVPLPAMPSEYMVADPVTSLKGIGWINDNWEGISALGWYGGTVILNKEINLLRIRLESSLIKFNNDDEYATAIKGDPDNFFQTTTNTVNYSDLTRLRAYAAISYDLSVFEGITILAAAKYENNSVAFPNTGSYKINKTFLAPSVDATVKWTKIFSTTVGARYELANFNDMFYGNSGTAVSVQDSTKFSRLIFPVSFLYSLPVGFYKLSGGIWTVLGYDETDALGTPDDPSDDIVTAKDPGANYGAYFVMEWEYGF